MADIFNQEQRSRVMRSIASKGNKSTEVRVIELFNDLEVKGWRRNYKVKGHPDFVFLKQHIAIFVDGCFWHGHSCRNTIPKDNSEYWNKKRERNVRHDVEITRLFQKRGWKVLRIWECELKNRNLYTTTNKLLRFIYDDFIE